MHTAFLQYAYSKYVLEAICNSNVARQVRLHSHELLINQIFLLCN